MVSAIGDIFIFEWGERYFRKTNQKWEINKIKAERTQQKSILRPVAVLYEAIKFFNRLVFPQVLQWFTIFLSFFFFSVFLIINDTYDVYLTSIHFPNQSPVSMAVRRDKTNIYRYHQLLVWISTLRWSYWRLEMSVKRMGNLFTFFHNFAAEWWKLLDRGKGQIFSVDFLNFALSTFMGLRGEKKNFWNVIGMASHTLLSISFIMPHRCVWSEY